MKAADILKLSVAQQASALEALDLDGLKELVKELVAEANAKLLKPNPMLSMDNVLKKIPAAQLRQHITALLNLFPKAPSAELALDSKFATQEERLDAIIGDINSERLPTYRYWELLYENLFIEPDKETATLLSSRTFVAYATPKLNSFDNLLKLLKSMLGQAEFNLYMNTPLFLAGKEEAIIIESLYFTKHSSLNIAELKLAQTNKSTLNNFLPKNQDKDKVDYAKVGTHNTSSHKSAEESHVGAFKMMLAANPGLGVVAQYDEPNDKGELHRKARIIESGTLDKFVKDRLLELQEAIAVFLKIESAELYDLCLRPSHKTSSYSELMDTEREDADKKVEGVRFWAEAALRFMSNMMNTRRCDSGKHSYSTDIKATCGLTMEEMVAVCYWASKDKDNFKDTAKHYTDATIMLSIIKQLYDMRRGYDIDHGTDKPDEYQFPTPAGRDNNRCQGGGINSLASALDAIHKAYNVKLVRREDIERDIKITYEKIAVDNISLIDNEDQDMLRVWSATGKVIGTFRETLKDIFEANHKQAFISNFKGYVADSIFEKVLDDALDNVPMPEELKQAWSIEQMTVDELYIAIANNMLPLLHLDPIKGYESTLNYLNKEDIIASLVNKAISSDIKEPRTHKVLLYLSRSNLAQKYRDLEILKIENRSIPLKAIAGLNAKNLEKLAEAESLDDLLNISTEGAEPNLFMFYANNIWFTESQLQKIFGRFDRTPLHAAIFYGARPIVTAIFVDILKNDIDKLTVLLKLGDYHDNTPLHQAVLSNNIEALKILFAIYKKDKDTFYELFCIGNNLGATLLDIAFLSGRIKVVKTIFDHSKEDKDELHRLLSIGNPFGSTPVHSAAFWGQHEVLKATFDFFKNDEGKSLKLITTQNNNGRTPAHVAAEQNKADSLKVIFDVFKDDKDGLINFANTCDKVGRNLVCLATNLGKVDALAVILDIFKEDKDKLIMLLNMQDNEGNTALQSAFYHSKIEVIKTVLNFFKEDKDKIIELLNTLEKDGSTTIEKALNNGKTEAITVVLDFFKEDKDKVVELFSIQNKKGSTPIQDSYSCARQKVIPIIFDYFKSDKDKFLKLLSIKNKAGYPNLMTFLYDQTNFMEIILNIFKEDKDKLAELLNIVDEDGNTLLHKFAYYKATDLLRIALDCFKEDKDKLIKPLSIHNKRGDTLLHLLADNDKIELVKTVFDFFGEDKDKLLGIKNRDNKTILQTAVFYNQATAVIAILNYFKENENKLNELVPSLLYECVSQDRGDILTAVFNFFKEDGDMLANISFTMLHGAATLGKVNVSTAILNRYKDNKDELIKLAHTKDKHGYPALHLAASNGHAKLLTTVFDFFENDESTLIKLLRAEDKDGRTLLNAAHHKKETKVVEAVLKTTAGQVLLSETHRMQACIGGVMGAGLSFFVLTVLTSTVTKGMPHRVTAIITGTAGCIAALLSYERSCASFAPSKR